MMIDEYWTISFSSHKLNIMTRRSPAGSKKNIGQYLSFKKTDAMYIAPMNTSLFQGV
jgi:hypothetical protein